MTTLTNTVSSHLSTVLKTVNVGRIREQNYKVVLDSHHGSGSILGRRLLEELNCDYKCLGDVPDGLFERSPEPTERNLQKRPRKRRR